MRRRLYKVLAIGLALLSLLGVWIEVFSFWRAPEAWAAFVGPHTFTLATCANRGTGELLFARMAIPNGQPPPPWEFHWQAELDEPVAWPNDPSVHGRFGFVYWHDAGSIFGVSQNWTAIGVPIWLISALLAVGAIACWRRARRIGFGDGVARCRNCGYDLRATPDRCPECGTVVGRI